jgi:hypothetical protein
VWSQDEESANWPSEEITTSETKWLCPWRMRFGYPYESSSRVSCHTMIVLSGCYSLKLATNILGEKTNLPRDAVKIMSGFSEEVAIAVTQPLWPAKEPRNRNCSPMLFRNTVLRPRVTG